MTRYLLVAAFGAAGAMARYAIDGWIGTNPRAQDFPFGTLAVNVLGSFALGILVALVAGHNHWRVALGAGFLASFTTFSTYAFQTVDLAENARWGLAVANVAVMTVAGLAAAAAGLVLGRALT